MAAVSSSVTSSSLTSFSQSDRVALGDCLDLCERLKVVVTNNLVLVNATTQQLHLLSDKQVQHTYSISTAANGLGQKEGTGKTPLGLHFIREKIGDGAAPFAIFRSRGLTGEVAAVEEGGKSIVGRILWLSGLQEGFNSGESKEGELVDTYKRYIYIHGTNDTSNLGKLVSAGCIRMHPEDVIKLFNQVIEGSLVYIYPS